MGALAAALLLASLPTATADDANDATPPAESDPEGPCQTFEYTLDPPAYHLDPKCIPLP